MAVFDRLFGSGPKPNLTPDISFPTQEQLHFTPQLRRLASQRIEGATTGRDVPGVGFGDDFVSKATNPVVTERLRRFREQTVPTISSDASSRGLGRSTLATNQVARAERDTQSDIDQLLAKFFVLNEQQKKTDLTQGINLGQDLQSQQAQLETNRASASERLANATAAQQLGRFDRGREGARFGVELGGRLATAAAGGFGGVPTAGSGSGTALSQFGVQPILGSQAATQGGFSGGPNTVLGALSNQGGGGGAQAGFANIQKNRSTFNIAYPGLT